jgi:Metallo-beta-lactamase superfamily
MTLSVRVFNTGYTPISGGPGWDTSKTATWPSSTATLIAGEHDAILVDALMTTEHGRQLASWIAAANKNLTTIAITHGHGDHFFGAGPVLQAYPTARLLALNDDVIGEARLHLGPEILSNWIGWFGDRFDHTAAVPEKFESQVLDVEGTPLNWLAVGGADGTPSSPEVGQTWLAPPSAVTVEPVLKLDRSLARNTAALAISSGSPNRPSGIPAMRSARNCLTGTFGFVCPARLSLPGVTVGPATITLTRIPRPLSSLAHVRANDRTAALVAA